MAFPPDRRARGARVGRWLGAAALLLLCPACKLLHPPLFPVLVYPWIEPSRDSIEVHDPDELVEGHEGSLGRVRIGVIENPARGTWESRVGEDTPDEREDENALFAEYLDDTDYFREVALVSSHRQREMDYYISCSADCIYEIELDSWMYAFNWMLLGVGFLLGFPHEDSSAFYVVEAVFYQVIDGELEAVGGTLVANERVWFGDSIYWRPEFYSGRSLDPLFGQITYDFLLSSGVRDG